MENFTSKRPKNFDQYREIVELLLENYRPIPMSDRDSMFDRFLEKFTYLVLCRITKDFTNAQAKYFIEVLKMSFGLNHEQSIILFVHNYYNYLMNMNPNSEPQKILRLMYENKPNAKDFIALVSSITDEDAKNIIRGYNEIKTEEVEIPSTK